VIAMENRKVTSEAGIVVTALGVVALLAMGIAACAPDDAECSGTGSCRNSNAGPGGPNGGDGSSADGGPEAPACTVVGKPHIGLGGVDIASKINVAAFADRARAKPYPALVSEYSRVLGAANKPSLIDSKGPTFGQPGDRWFIEPLASAVFVDTAYEVAFEGCLKLTGDVAGGTAEARFATAPTADSAKAVCGEWMRSFWSREGTPDQIQACVSAITETTTETYGGGDTSPVSRAVTPKRQWAYGCASVLTATGFLMY
jgi:hypothetical protein